MLERKQEFTIIYFFVKMLEHLLGTVSRTVYITVQWPNRKRPESVHHRTNSVLKARCRLKDSLRMRFSVPGEELLFIYLFKQCLKRMTQLAINNYSTLWSSN